MPLSSTSSKKVQEVNVGKEGLCFLCNVPSPTHVAGYNGKNKHVCFHCVSPLEGIQGDASTTQRINSKRIQTTVIPMAKGNATRPPGPAVAPEAKKARGASTAAAAVPPPKATGHPTTGGRKSVPVAAKDAGQSPASTNGGNGGKGSKSPASAANAAADSAADSAALAAQKKKAAKEAKEAKKQADALRAAFLEGQLKRYNDAVMKGEVPLLLAAPLSSPSSSSSSEAPAPVPVKEEEKKKKKGVHPSFECDLCKVVFLEQYTKDQHMKLFCPSKKYQCPKCRCKFETEVDMQEHWEDSHPQPSGVKAVVARDGAATQGNDDGRARLSAFSSTITKHHTADIAILREMNDRNLLASAKGQGNDATVVIKSFFECLCKGDGPLKKYTEYKENIYATQLSRFRKLMVACYVESKLWANHAEHNITLSSRDELLKMLVEQTPELMKKVKKYKKKKTDGGGFGDGAVDDDAGGGSGSDSD